MKNKKKTKIIVMEGDKKGNIELDTLGIAEQCISEELYIPKQFYNQNHK